MTIWRCVNSTTHKILTVYCIYIYFQKLSVKKYLIFCYQVTFSYWLYSIDITVVFFFYFSFFFQKMLLLKHRCWHSSKTGPSEVPSHIHSGLSKEVIHFCTYFIFHFALWLLQSLKKKQGLVKCKSFSKKSIYVIWSREEAQRQIGLRWDHALKI